MHVLDKAPFGYKVMVGIFYYMEKATKQVAQHDRFKIYLLNGKHTGNLGVIDHRLDLIAIKITGLKRDFPENGSRRASPPLLPFSCS